MITRSEVNFDSLEYADSFCAGWNLARCGDDLKHVQDIVSYNKKHWKKTNKTRKIPSNLCKGIIDGWKARRSFIKLWKHDYK